MSVFSGGDGWRQSTPGAWMVDAARIAAPAGQAFSSAFNAAADRAQGDRQFDAKMAESKREFDTLNPPLPESTSGGASAADTMMNGPGGRWDGAAPAAQSGWQGYQLNKPTDALAAIYGAPDMEAANKVVQEITKTQPDWFTNKTFTKTFQDGLQSVASRERVRISAQTAENGSVASRILVKDAADFNKRVGIIDPESRAAIIGMEKNPDGTVSPNAWRALTMAEEAAQLRAQNERTSEENKAMIRGDQQRTVVSEKGIVKTFTPPKPESVAAAPVAPQETSLSDGSRIVFNPKTGSFRFMAKAGQEKELTAPQLKDIATHLAKQDENDPNAKLISSFLGSMATNQIGKATASKAATPSLAPSTPPPAETPTKLLRENIVSEFEAYIKLQK